MSGLRGCTRTRAICRVSSSPTCFQVLPASVDLYTPSPCETFPRIGDSPMPTYTTLGSDSEMPIAPTDPVLKYSSETGSQLTPPSVVFHTPPPVAPK